MNAQTYMTRADEVGASTFDSIAWLFEVHIRKPDERVFNFAVLYGNEDCPARIDLWREEPMHDIPPDYVWTREEVEE